MVIRSDFEEFAKGGRTTTGGAGMGMGMGMGGASGSGSSGGGGGAGRPPSGAGGRYVDFLIPMYRTSRVGACLWWKGTTYHDTFIALPMFMFYWLVGDGGAK